MGLTARLEALAGSELRLDEIRLDSRESIAVGDREHDTLLYCDRGHVSRRGRLRVVTEPSRPVLLYDAD